jgi:hypothetical protein
VPQRLIVTPEAVRVLFTAHEAEGFLRGAAALPEGGTDDVLHRVVRRVLKRLALDFPGEAEGIEVHADRVPRAEPADPAADAPGASAPGVAWYAVRFRLVGAGATPDGTRALEAWVAEQVPQLTFGVHEATTAPAIDGSTPADAG